MNINADAVIESFRLQPFQEPPSVEGNQPLFEQLIREIPSPEMYFSLFERLEHEAKLVREEARRQAHARAWELARQQGVKPIHDIKELQGDFWPEDESVDKFLELVRATRQQDKVGADE
jgi:hypothetical protein